MKAIILAAGRSSRLYPITLETPKCLLEIGGEKIINRQVNAIREAGINDILIVIGYKGDLILDELGSTVRYREYNDYSKTNNLHTLWNVKDELNEDFICLFSDVLFDPIILNKAKESSQDFCMMIDTSQILTDTMRVKLEHEKLTSIGSHISIKAGSGNFIGIAKFSKIGARKLCSQMAKLITGHKNDYYTIAIDALAKKGIQIGYIDVKDNKWAEIDTKVDLDNANEYYNLQNLYKNNL